MKMKAFYDSEKPTKNLVTTISGIVLLVVTLLATLGVITSDQATALNAQLGILGGAITAIIGVISSIILIFKAEDPMPEGYKMVKMTKGEKAQDVRMKDPPKPDPSRPEPKDPVA